MVDERTGDAGPVKVGVAQLFPPRHQAYYLFGEDHDALFEAAEGLLHWESDEAQLIRVDADEIARIEVEGRNGSLFGATACHAMVRNAESARSKQIEQLFSLIANPPAQLRLIVCAAGIESRKALHKRMLASDGVACCHFPRPSSEQFRSWLESEVEKAGLQLSADAVELLADRLDGMRQAARQAIERMRLYDDGCGETLEMEVVGDLLGERSPEDLGAYCTAVAARSPKALSVLRHLLRDEQVAELQVLGWLSNRLQQLLLYLWYAADNPRTAASKARLFGDARKLVPQEVKQWRAGELIRALQWVTETEALLKGASIEDKAVVMERLTLRLLQGDHT
ncbi:MAG TPA: DNA polymerase III subunit delta [Mariprofundaceae bacterium]|nr:DNA polymerase III subunit delta [Mariprofundaceae bacterium]